MTVVEKRRSHGWQAFGSYTLSRASGLQPSSGTTAAGRAGQHRWRPAGVLLQAVTFGRDPNDLTNASGRLPNDRPHMFRAMGSVDVPRTGFVVAANLQIFSGKPWAATALVSLPQNTSSAFCSSRAARAGCRRRSLLDLRVSRTIAVGGVGRIELLLDVLNALNDTAEEGAGDGQSVQPEFRSAHGLRGSAPRDGRREGHARKVNLRLTSHLLELLEPVEDHLDLIDGAADVLHLPRCDAADEPAVWRDVVRRSQGTPAMKNSFGTATVFPNANAGCVVTLTASNPVILGS